ncbi:Cerebroside-sulfatase [Planctomycetales bacterium 10988]|nr:Cerebroside-sulfatase [Planctomycetales bacterium 10988]
MLNVCMRTAVGHVSRWVMVTAVAVVGVLITEESGQAKDPQSPNIIVILADDLGQGDLGCFNPKSKIPTPNMNRLAKEGMKFTDAHSPSSVCTPTRYGLLTGRYSWRTRLKKGVLQGEDRLLISLDRLTMPKMLQQAGYQTGAVGKWHLGLQEYDPEQPELKTDYSRPLRPGPLEVGFDFFYGIPASLDMQPYVFVRNHRPEEPPTETTEDSTRRWSGGEGFWRGGPISPSFRHIDVLPNTQKEAVKFINRHVKNNKDEPFFLYVPFSAPHTPWLPTKKFVGSTEVNWYGDFVHQVDATVGQILNTLDRHQLADNTLVIVTSDNGSHWRDEDIKEYGHDANEGLRGMKADIWEGGHRVPFVARWPGKIPAQSTCDATICLTDIAATTAEIVHVDLPQDAMEDSFSLMPLFEENPEGFKRTSIVHHSGRGVFAIRQGDWKLAEELGSGGFSLPRIEKPKPNGPTGQLYNLKEDPKETNNLWLKQPEMVKKLQQELDQIRNQGRSRL